MLLVLAIVWAAVLVSWIRSRASSNFADSVGTFRRHLKVLERAAPSTVRPANRMRVPSAVLSPPYRLTPKGRPAVRPAAAPPARARAVGGRPAAVSAGAVTRRPVSTTAAALRRRRSQKRRRDVLLFLVGAAVGTLALSAVPGLRRLVYANVIFDIMLVAYVALLVRLRNLHAEREMKLTFLPPVRPVPAGLVPRGTGRYASLASTMDTGELALNRAIN